MKENIIRKRIPILYKLGPPAVILPDNSRHTMGYSSGGYLNPTLSEITACHGDSWLFFYLD